MATDRTNDCESEWMEVGYFLSVGTIQVEIKRTRPSCSCNTCVSLTRCNRSLPHLYGKLYVCRSKLYTYGRKNCLMSGHTSYIPLRTYLRALLYYCHAYSRRMLSCPDALPAPRTTTCHRRVGFVRGCPRCCHGGSG